MPVDIVIPAVPSALMSVPRPSSDLAWLGQHLTAHEQPWLGTVPIPVIREYQKGHEGGQVFMGKRLSRLFRRDANVVAALGQRVAPWLGCDAELVKGDEDLRAELTEALSERGTMLPRAVLRDMAEDLAMCGLAVLHHPWKPREDGSRWEPCVETWDLESVDWDHQQKCYVALTREMGRVPIRHGEGLFSIIRSNDLHAHQHGAVIPLAIHVASRMSGIVDRNSGSRAVGMPKIWGKLPPKIAVLDQIGLALGIALDNAMQGLSKIVTTNETELKAIEFNSTGMGQFFESILKSDRTDIFFALTGQDGSAQSAGGNYQKAQVLEAVLFAWIVADTMAGASGITTGLLRPYAALNYGDPNLAPSVWWPLPDPDEDARVEETGKRHKALNEVVKLYRDNGFEVTQEWVDALALVMGIDPPRIQAKQLPELRAYHMRNKLFTRNEFREDRGRPALPGAEGQELIDELAQPERQGPVEPG